MEPWAWLLAYIVGFALLQLLLYRYLQGESTSEGSPQPRPERPEHAERPEPPERPEPARPRPDGGARTTEDGGIYCRHCGTLNERDQAYTFCRECTNPLQ